MRKRVVIESPYSGNVARNKAYLQRAIRHSISLYEAPIASHQMYTDALNDESIAERKLGLECGMTWLRLADVVVVYLDYGLSTGMLLAIDLARGLGIEVIEREIGRNEDI